MKLNFSAEQRFGWSSMFSLFHRICFSELLHVCSLHRLQIKSKHAPTPSGSWLLPAGLHQDDPGKLWSLEVLLHHRNGDDYHKARKVTAPALWTKPGRNHLCGTAFDSIICLFFFFKLKSIFWLWCICFRRMFPHCSISLSGLQPYANYVVMVDMVPVDSFKYKVNLLGGFFRHSRSFSSIPFFFTFCFACWGLTNQQIVVCKTQQSAARLWPAHSGPSAAAYQSLSLLPVCALSAGGPIN